MFTKMTTSRVGIWGLQGGGALFPAPVSYPVKRAGARGKGGGRRRGGWGEAAAAGQTGRGAGQPRTETPEKERTARPRTGWPKRRAGSKTLQRSMSSTWARVALSVGPETMR